MDILVPLNKRVIIYYLNIGAFTHKQHFNVAAYYKSFMYQWTGHGTVSSCAEFVLLFQSFEMSQRVYHQPPESWDPSSHNPSTGHLSGRTPESCEPTRDTHRPLPLQLLQAVNVKPGRCLSYVLGSAQLAPRRVCVDKNTRRLRGKVSCSYRTSASLVRASAAATSRQRVLIVTGCGTRNHGNNSD